MGSVIPRSRGAWSFAWGRVASGSLAKGYVCVYVLAGTNLGSASGTGAIHRSSIAPGTLASKLGFKIGWDPDNAGDTYVDAVWAFKG